MLLACSCLGGIGVIESMLSRGVDAATDDINGAWSRGEEQ